MAETKKQAADAETAPVEAQAPAPVAAPVNPEVPETLTIAKYKLTHKGFGKYAVEGTGKTLPSLHEAKQFVADLLKAEAFTDQFGDIVPEGIEIRERTLEIRGSLTELPMNEVYLEDGSVNPYYDRAWVWGWGRATGNDIASKQAKGYRLVSRDELESEVKDGKVPDHYLSLLMPIEHGTRLLYGDLALMRQPRILWRQQRAAEEARATSRIKVTEEQNHAALDQAGVKNLSGPISNEVSSGLRMSGF